MPVIVGSGGTGSEGKSDRMGLPTGTSDPGSASAGDMYYKTDTIRLGSMMVMLGVTYHLVWVLILLDLDLVYYLTVTLEDYLIPIIKT